MTEDVHHALEQNEALRKENETLEQSCFSLQIENSIFEQKIFTLQHICNDYTSKYKSVVSQNELLKLQQKYAAELMRQPSNSQQIAQLEHALQISKEEIIEKDKIMNVLSLQIAELSDSVRNNKRELQKFRHRTEQNSFTKKCEIDRMSGEIVLLTHQNNALFKEKMDLLSLIEDKKANLLILPSDLRKYSSSTTLKRIQSNIYNQPKNTLSLSKTCLLVQEMDTAYLSPSEFDNHYLPNTSIHFQQSKSTHSNQTLSVSDHGMSGIAKELFHNKSTDLAQRKRSTFVLDSNGISGDLKTFDQTKKDYLHFTAHVMTLKYPELMLSSVDLINKIDNESYNFWEYYDVMDAMMKEQFDAMQPKLQKQTAMLTQNPSSIPNCEQ